MIWNHRLSAAFGLCAALLLTGCQNTMTRIELPSAAAVTWSTFFTTLDHPTEDLELLAQGDGLTAQLVPQGCSSGSCLYFLVFEIDNTFATGALVFSDANDGAFARIIEIVRGTGREIIVHYNLLPPPDEQNPAEQISFLVMAPADPSFRSNFGPFMESGPPPGVALCANIQGVLDAVEGIGGEIGGLPFEIPGIEGDFDFMAFEASSGSGVVRCNGDPPPAAIPTLSQWALLLAATLLLLTGGVLRRRPG